MENKKIRVAIQFSQSKTYKTDWKVRYTFQDGYKTIIVYDEISKSTRFGEIPNKVAMQIYATDRATEITSGFGCEVEVVFT